MHTDYQQAIFWMAHRWRDAVISSDGGRVQRIDRHLEEVVEGVRDGSRPVALHEFGTSFPRRGENPPGRAKVVALFPVENGLAVLSRGPLASIYYAADYESLFGVDAETAIDFSLRRPPSDFSNFHKAAPGDLPGVP